MSTLESAIAFSLIIIMLSFMITGPEAIALDSFECTKDGGNELFYMEEDDEVLKEHYVGGAVCYDATPERLCTFISGISDTYRLLYGSVFELAEEG